MTINHKILTKMKNINKIKGKIEKIKSLGYVLSVRPDAIKNDGAIGNTFEDLFDVEENNLREADYDGWEFKSQRKFTKSASSLFSLKPSNKEIKGDNYMVENYGYYDKEYSHIKCLRTSLYASRFSLVNQRNNMKINVDEKNQKINLIYADLNEKIIDDRIYWDFDDLKRGTKKLKNTIVVKAGERLINDKIHFKFTEASAYINFNFDKFIDCVKNGIVRYDNRIGIYRTGEKKGKRHNHGGGFRLVSSKNYHKLFDDFLINI